MHGDTIKRPHVEIKHKSENTKIPLEVVEGNIKHPKYIVLDFETGTSNIILEDDSVLLHQVMRVEADVIQNSDNHRYINIYIYVYIREDLLLVTLSFTGYDCCTDFCKCLVYKQHTYCTIMTHNGAGYENTLILQWCIIHGLNPAMFIRQW